MSSHKLNEKWVDGIPESDIGFVYVRTKCESCGTYFVVEGIENVEHIEPKDRELFILSNGKKIACPLCGSDKFKFEQATPL